MFKMSASSTDVVAFPCAEARRAYIEQLKRQPVPDDDDIKNIKDVPGWADLSIDEQIEVFDHYFLLDKGRTVPLKTKAGLWAVTRDPYNDRGDASSVEKRAKSVETVGIRNDLRKGAFLIQSDSEDDDTWTSGHWATLIDGARKACDRDPLKKNKVVQASIAAGLPDCKCYKRSTPPWGRVHLKDYGNLLNDEVTSTTWVEKCRATEAVDLGFEKKKKANGWSIQSIGQQAMEEKKFQYAEALYEGRWSSKTSLIDCGFFYRESKKVIANSEEVESKQISVWDLLVSRANQEIDMQHPVARNHTFIFKVLAVVLRKLRASHPEWIVPISLMFLPTASETGYGVCPLLPKGLPKIAITKLNEDALEELCMPMVGTARFTEKTKTAKKNKVKSCKAKAKARPPVFRTRAAKARFDANQIKKQASAVLVQEGIDAVESALLPCAADPVSEYHAQKSFLSHVNDTMLYLIKIDKAQEDFARAYKLIAVRGALMDGVELKVRGATKLVKGFKSVTTITKATYYRRAKLAPRASDPDMFDVDLEQILTAEVGGAPSSMVVRRLDALLEEHAAAIIEVAQFEKQHSSKLPVLAHMYASTGLNKVMMALMQRAAESNGVLIGEQMATELLQENAMTEAEEVFPESWVAGLAFLDEVRVANTMDEVKKEACSRAELLSSIESIINNNFTENHLHARRMSLMLHICSSLGCQMFMKQEGPVMTQKPYLAPLVQSAVSEELSRFDLTKLKVEETPTIVRDLMKGLKITFRAASRYWFGRLATMSDHCIKFDGKAYGVKREGFMRQLNASNNQKALEAVKQDMLIQPELVPVEASVNLFPVDRMTTIEMIMRVFEKENKEEHLANLILQNPRVYCNNALNAEHLNHVKEMESKAQEEKDAAAVLPITDDDDAPTSLVDWVKSLAEDEKTQMGLSIAQVRLVQAHLNSKFMELCSDGIDELEDNNLDIEGPMDKEKKGVKVGLFRSRARGTETMMSFWGRIVEVEVASTMKKEQCLPLICTEGPRFFLEGSSCCNPTRSDYCPAWSVPAVPKQGEEEPDILPPAKKKRNQDKKEKDKPIATHEISYEPLDVVCFGKTFTYQRPVLIDIKLPAGETHRYDSKCFRKRFEWDDEELKKKSREARIKSFINS